MSGLSIVTRSGNRIRNVPTTPEDAMLDTDLDRTEFVHLTLPADPARLPPLRRQLRRCLAPLPMPPDRQDEVLLAVAEATANAVEHAYDPAEPGDVELIVWTESDALCVEVRD